jgi:hypothetical protein
VIQETDGAGIAGIIPVAASSKYLSLFPPVTPSSGSLQEGLAQCPESRASKAQAEFQKNKVVPTFAVGDVVVPYRHYDNNKKELLPGPTEGLKDTKWRVKDITYKHVRLELIEGEYKPRYTKGTIYRAGEFSTDFASSDGYKAAKPYGGNLGQIFEEFKKDD